MAVAAQSSAGWLLLHSGELNDGQPLKPDSRPSVVSGIYRFSRNPMYLGFLFGLLGWAIFLSNPWPSSSSRIHRLHDRFQIEPEEKALAVLFGAVRCL
jgi:protein-S-isoprenylcysteine O-methyltransferase Ste14